MMVAGRICLQAVLVEILYLVVMRRRLEGRLVLGRDKWQQWALGLLEPYPAAEAIHHLFLQYHGRFTRVASSHNCYL